MEGYIEKMLALAAPLAPNRVQRVQWVQGVFLFRLPIRTRGILYSTILLLVVVAAG